MLRDVFYYGLKPNAHPREKHAIDLADARQQCTTEHFWIINEHCDYKNFDWDWSFDFLSDEDVWAEEHNNVWPSQYQKDSGTWLCSKEYSELIIYRADVDPMPLKDEIPSNWKIVEYIEKNKFDFKWHPDPSDPPYIYVFGNQWYSGTTMPTVEYHVKGAISRKYITEIIAHLLPIPKLFETIHEVESFDYSWRPDPTSPPYIYVFGNTQYPASVMPTIEYHVPGATERKFIENIKPKLVQRPQDFIVLDDIERTSFDFSWIPDPNAPPYIYVWGNQWNKPEDKASIKYVVEGATEYKYMEERVTRKPSMTNWSVPAQVVQQTFDFSWEPNPNDPPYFYRFGSQWQKTGGPVYETPGATEVKYIDTLKCKVIPHKFDHWLVPKNVDQLSFDFSWHPDDTEPDFIYQFPTQWSRSGGPRYSPPGAVNVKYMEAPVATAKVDMTHWYIPEENLLDVTGFDFSWHPDIEDKPYIYQFGTQWQKTGGPIFTAPGCNRDTEIKYIDIAKAKKLPSMKNWDVPITLDIDKFDFSWHPDESESAYIYQFPTKYSKVAGPRYIVPGATEVKYVSEQLATLYPIFDNWDIPDKIDRASFDFSWAPDIEDKPYIYQFGTQWQKTDGPRYITPGATEVKYIDVITSKRMSDFENKNWKSMLPVEKFDYSWHPDNTEEPYIYVFGNQWNSAELEPTIEYHVPGATQKKYIHDTVAEVAQYKEGWELLEEVDTFDFSWRPNPTDPPYIYVFGTTQYPGTIMPSVKLHKAGATQEKFIDDIVAKLAQKPDLFSNTELIKEFDYSWRPNPKDPPFVYQFGTQWAKTHGPQFKVTGAVENKFISEPVATILPDMSYWEIPKDVDITKFDFSWHPDSTSPPYIYQFGTILDEDDGPKYIVPGNTGIVVKLERPEIILSELDFPKYYLKTTLEDLIEEHEGEIFWALNPELDYSNFDFKWVPDKQNVYHVNAFGSKDNINTQTYFVNGKMWQRGYKDINYIEDKTIDIKTKIDMFFVDRGNSESNERFEKLKEKYSNLTKTRYLNSWVDTINRCTKKSSTNLCWILNSELDYTEFEFDFYPSPWQMRHVHVFGTQWSHWGTTFMVNKNSFADDTKYIKVIEHLSNLNFVKRRTAKASNCLYNIYVIDHKNSHTPNVVKQLESKATGKKVTVVKYDNSYLKTFKEILKSCENKNEHYIWVCASVCDYENFDFTYVCDPFAKEQLHVFPSDKQKFGDTFLVDVNKLRALITDMSLLEDYEKVNYNQHQRAKRLPAPKITSLDDTHFKDARQQFDFPYAILTTYDNVDLREVDYEPMSLWTPDSKNLIITSTGATRVVVPQEAKNYIESELYDYPYISSSNKLAQSKPLDIVFLSNGEKGADENYEHLLKVTKGLSNRVVRVEGVNGRVQAYHAAAKASETPWMFTVFAKLRVDNKFDWNWQPDRLQIPKHYIFNATNPVNGLVYGHQAMIAYNKKITLANSGTGLDFTLDNEHEVVDINSGIAIYNTDEYSTWRTSFREALKLKATVVNNPNDASSIERLSTWATKGEGNFGEYSIKGALDAIEYYDEVNGDINKLKLSYEWEWLRSKFNKLTK